MSSRVRSTAVAFSLAAAVLTPASAQAERWEPAGSTAEALTGTVKFSPSRITFQNGKSLALSQAGTTRFTNDMNKTVSANVYKVVVPEDPALVSGNKLCGGKKVAYLLVWRTRDGSDEFIEMNAFSGSAFKSGSPDDCGRYAYSPAQ